MKLLLDQGLPRSSADLLGASGFDAVHVGSIGRSTATDSALLEFAVSKERIIVTLDSDFHRLLALSKADRPSVVRIRIEGLKAEPLAKLVETLLPRFEEELLEGAIMTIQENRVRLRRLPLLS